ncbi:MAG TPA: hypothetical protein VGZ22_14665, partial [Isosphaeraceae bacterium]|nr:hypothetical protein [Isosphaeraceae bacterium]
MQNRKKQNHPQVVSSHQVDAASELSVGEQAASILGIQAATVPSSVSSSPRLAGLDRSVQAWARRGDAEPLIRWLDRTLDVDGVPRRLRLADWPACLSALSEAYLQREARWRVVVDARVEGFLRAMLRFGRPDGSLVFEPGPPPQDRAQQLRFWAERLSDPALAAVLDIWSPSTAQNRRRRSAPPLPADARPDRPLAILRADWSPQGDLLAIDQRDRDQPCLLELVGLGRQWLGPRWLSGSDFEPTSPPRPTVWRTGPYADLAEWTFRTGGSRVSRSALLLRGRQLALIAEQVDGGDGDASWRVELPPDVTPINLPGTRALMLSAARGGTSRVLPIGLPTLSYPTERGSLVAEGQQLILRQHREGRRC